MKRKNELSKVIVFKIDIKLKLILNEKKDGNT